MESNDDAIVLPTYENIIKEFLISHHYPFSVTPHSFVEEQPYDVTLPPSDNQ
jgi:hypothetical protein